MPVLCFICNAKLYGERIRVCSSTTPHSKASYAEMIGELMGEDFVIIVTPADHMCKRCTSLLIRMDQLENDLKLVKNSILTNVQKKYGMLPADHPVMSPKVVNGNLITNDLEMVQRRVPSGLNLRGHSTSAGRSNATTKIRQDPSKIKIYKCDFCPFQSKDLGHFGNHMQSHMKKKDNEKSNQTVMKTATQQQKPQQKQHQTNHQMNKQQQQLYIFQEQDIEIALEESVCLPHNIIKSTEIQQVSITNEVKSSLIDQKCIMDDIPDKISEVPTQETQNISENMCGQTELLKDNQEISAAKVDMCDMAIGGGEIGTDYLDIESMLAAIHNDVVSSPNDGGKA